MSEIGEEERERYDRKQIFGEKKETTILLGLHDPLKVFILMIFSIITENPHIVNYK